MTYKNLYELKFKRKIPTIELEKRFPKDRKKISKLALLDLPMAVLKAILPDRKELFRVMGLRQALLPQKRAQA